MSTDSGAGWLSAALGLPNGATPFPWQARLLSDWLAGRAPRALDLPTGLGKTSVLAIWLVARALGASLPRRLVYLVDRRAVVDQATRVAEELRDTVARTPELRAALGLKGPLPISTLRGQFIDNRDWLSDPAAPAIVVGTVDMIGSRLLFSGYGVSRKMRPYHAGLLGADALFVLDEAHLVPPFERLLDQIASGSDAHGRSLQADGLELRAAVPAFRVLALSATGRQRVADETFGLADEDRRHPVVRQRLEAVKRIRLLDAVDAKGLPEALAVQAWNLCAQGRAPVRTIVFVNSRDHANKVQAALFKLAGKAPVPDVVLFVGGRRVHEREQAASRLNALGFLAGSAHRLERPAFVVATSAGEVGVDLDAEHAVCDLVAWERMVQRLGRVNRRGDGRASVLIVPALSDHEATQARQAAALDVLKHLPLAADGSLDGSPAALSGLKARAEALDLIERASTPARLHPPLTRALVDAWAMTSLERHTGRPEVDPWLRGWPEEREEPQLCLIWRTHLPVDDDARLFAARQMELFLEAAGPHVSERLEADLPLVADWLQKRAKSLIDKARPTPMDKTQPAPLTANEIAVVLVGDDGQTRALTMQQLAAIHRRELEGWLLGTTVWVQARFGGLTDGLLDEASDAFVDDVTEIGSFEQPGPVPFGIRRLGAEEVTQEPDGWRNEASLPLKSTEEGVVVWLVVSSPLSVPSSSEEGRSGARQAQLLSAHQAWAETAARALAQTLNLSADHTEMLAVAACVHDEGKQADCWQRAFHAPNRGRPAYAKTVGRPDVSQLNGYRHEFGSLPFAEAHPRVQALAPELRALCLHLVAAHHGSARPLIRTDGAAEPPSRAVARAREVALRYAVLSERWGPWGLAWWESLLRAADQQASRRNDEEGARRG